MVIFTFGCFFSKSATVFAQKALPSPVVALCQNVMVVAPPLLPLLAPPPLLLQAVSPAAPITRAADTAKDFLSFMSSSSSVEQQKMRRLPPAERNWRRLLTCASACVRLSSLAVTVPSLRRPR